MLIRYQKYIESTEEIRGGLAVEQFDYSVNVSLMHNYMYVETPKAGCSSIKASLQKYEWSRPDYDVGMFEEVHTRPLSPLLAPRTICDFSERINSGCWYQFCFVREPFGRLLSAYLDKICSPSEQRKKLLKSSPEFSGKEVSFASFARAIYAQEFESMDNHWRPQHQLLCHDKIKYDKIGRMENFDEGLLEILNNIGAGPAYMTMTKPHQTEAGKKLLEYYTPEIIELVVSKYAKDFEIYGYSSTLE